VSTSNRWAAWRRRFSFGHSSPGRFRRLAVEPLEDRRLLSSASAVQPQTLADLPAAAQQEIAAAIDQDQPSLVEQANLTASDGAANDHFGESVSISGNTVVVGAPSVSGAGAAYVFTESGTIVTQTAKLTASDGEAHNEFGDSVSISGSTVVVGAPFATAGGDSQNGAAYVFTEPGSGWANMTQTAELTSSKGRSGDAFGASVSISGTTVAVGAGGAKSDQGAAYVFTEPGSGWANMTQTAELTASDGAVGDYLGNSVSIDGNTLVVGDGSQGLGAAYVFAEPSSGWASMTQTAKLTASDGAAGDLFGWSVSTNGNTVVVGAQYAEVGSNRHQGAAYVFTELDPGWANATQTAKLTASDGVAGDDFGLSVAISSNTVVVGADKIRFLGATGPGAAYIVTEPSSGWVSVAQADELTPSGGAAFDYFGYSVSISGNTVVVGADEARVGANANQGEAYVFGPSNVTAVSTTAAADSGYAAGGTVPITVSFNEVVSVSGTPELALNDGGVASYTSGSGTATLTFNYVVAAGQGTPDLDYVSNGSLTLNGGSIEDSAGNAVMLTLPATGTDGLAANNIAVGLTVQTVATTAAANSRYTVGGTVPITVSFNEAVSVSGTPQLALNDGGVANYAGGSGTAALTFNYVVAFGQSTPDLDYASTGALTLNGGSIVDSVGNAAVLTLPVVGLDGLATQEITVVSLMATPGLYDPATSWWYLRNSNTTGVADIMAGYGPPGGNWIPLSGDWTGSGIDTLGLYNPATGFFYLHNSNTTGVGEIALFYGDPGQGWIPVVGDWTGQRSSAGYPIDTVGLYDPATCTWYLRNELTTGAADITIAYGPPGQGWLPLVGDWAGSGTTTVGLYNPATDNFYLRDSNTTGMAEVSFAFGDPTKNWTPVAGDWTGTGHDSIGMYDPSTGTWYLRNELSTGVADITFGYGAPGAGWLPVVGDWSGTAGAPASAANNSLNSSATVSAPPAQADWQPIVAAAVTNSSSLLATTQAIDVTGDQPQLPAVDPKAVDQPLGQAANPGDVETPATSLTLPTGVQRNATAGAADAVFAQLS
jgi:hypothetical protein